MSTQEESTRQLVVTKVAEILCGIEIESVHEIILMQEITTVPKSPRNMLGVINVRGAVLPVVDLRPCLGFPSAPFTADTRVVLVTYHDDKIGLLVDAVAEVITVTKEAFQSMKGNAGESSFLRSVARLEGRLILDIDHERVVQDGLEREPSDTSPLVDMAEDELTDEDTTADVAETAEETAEDDGGFDVELLESSLEQLAPKREELAGRFCQRLFEAEPDARSLIPDDVAGQKEALLDVLSDIVSNLRAPEKLTAYLEDLAARHVEYRALEGHYDIVGDVLLATLAEVAADAWSAELQAAWEATFAAVKEIMPANAETLEGAAA